MVPDGDGRADAQDQRADGARLGLGERARAGVEARARPAEEAPALRGVAVEVDPVRVLPRVALEAVRVEVAHEEELDAGRRRRRAEQVDDLAALGLVAMDGADDEHLARRLPGRRCARR